MGLLDNIFNRAKGENGNKSNLTESQIFAGLAIDEYLKKNFRDSIVHFSHAINKSTENKSPNYSRLFLMRGTAYEDSGNDLNAEKDFLRALEIETKNYIASYRLGMLYSRQNKVNKAITYLHSSYKDAPSVDLEHIGLGKNNIYFIDKKIICSNLGNLLIQTDQLDAALPFLNEAIKKDPQYSKPYALKGIVLYKGGQNDQALEYLQRAYELGDKSVIEFINEIKEKRKGINTNENDLKNLYQKVLQYSNEGKFDLALQVVEKMKSLPVNKSGIYFLSATIKATAFDWEGCIIDSKRCLDLDPQNSAALNHLGVALCKIGDIKNGLKALEKAVNLGNISASGNYKYWKSKH